MSSRVTDAQLKAATAIVRNTMLSTIDNSEVSVFQFSEQFETRISELKKTRKRQQQFRKIARTCAAALITLVLGLSMFFTFNTEARAAVISWIKEVLADRTTYYFTQEGTTSLPEYEMTWIPDNMECVHDESTPYGRAIIYMNPDDPTLGFTLDYSIMQDGSATMIITNEAEHTITDVIINGCVGELYISHDPNIASCLIWFDEENQVTFNMTWVMDDVDTILKIAEELQFQNSK